jgi:antitoxin PrlF
MVIFLEENAAMIALKNAQDAFAGEAERLDLKTEQDVVNLVKDVRRVEWEENQARHD